MNKKISVGLTITLILAAAVITAAVSVFISMNVFDDKISDLPEREAAYAYLSEADAIIRSDYYGDTDAGAFGGGAVAGYLEALPVGTNFYLSPEEYSAYKTAQAGKAPDGTDAVSVAASAYASAGYIKISAFYDTTPAEFEKAYDALERDGATSLIIDLRDVQSINVDSAAKTLDRIVPVASEGTQAIAVVTDAEGKKIESFSADSESVSLPVAVIINEKTAGAAELFACDIRDFGKGIVVGSKSVGSGTYQKLYELSDGGAMVLTVGLINPYTSDPFDGVGIAPDYHVMPDGKAEEGKPETDNVFLQAFAAVSAYS